MPADESPRRQRARPLEPWGLDGKLESVERRVPLGQQGIAGGGWAASAERCPAGPTLSAAYRENPSASSVS
jgi:hypothetical protein